MSDAVNEFLSEGAETYGDMGSDLQSVETSQLLGATFTIYGFKILNSDFGPNKYAAMDITVGDGKDHFLWTNGSGVLQKQLLHNKENLPFRAGLEERQSASSSNSYFTFVPAS